MIYLSSVSPAQVLAALADCPDETKAEAKKHQLWFEWVFDRDDLGALSEHDKANPSLVGSVAVTHPLRLQWMQTPEGAASAAKHDYFMDRLATGMDMGWIVIHPAAGSDRQILDGAHRVHAAYQFGTRRSGFGVKVFWTSPR